MIIYIFIQEENQWNCVQVRKFWEETLNFKYCILEFQQPKIPMYKFQLFHSLYLTLPKMALSPMNVI